MITRRHFLLSTGLTALQSAAPAAQKQNVLFISVDDLNDWIGCLGGNPDVRTPNFDRLASRGVLFTNAHCAAPLCNPSRAALMTGIRPSTSGVYQNNQPWRGSPVLKNAVTLPQHFMQNGYQAIAGGKIYHGSFPDPPSWNAYFPSQKQNQPPNPLPENRPLNGMPQTAHFDWGPVNAKDSEMGDMKTVDWAIERLNEKREQPLFLGVGIYRPHLPWYVPPKYFDLYPLSKITLPSINQNDLDDVPPPGVRMARPEGDHRRVMEHKQWRQAVQGYLASISFADAALGRLLDGFDRSPYAKNTSVVLWSDHGWHLGEKLHWRKFSLWEEATHNVLMMTVPGVTKSNMRCARTVNLLDIYPTLLDVCNLPERKAVEGQSLMPLLRNPSAQWNRPALTTYGRGNHSVRSEKWRYIRYHDGSEELYDCIEDPLEWTNLAGKTGYEAVKKEHAQWLPRLNAPDVESVKGTGEIA